MLTSIYVFFKQDDDDDEDNDDDDDKSSLSFVEKKTRKLFANN